MNINIWHQMYALAVAYMLPTGSLSSLGSSELRRTVSMKEQPLLIKEKWNPYVIVARYVWSTQAHTHITCRRDRNMMIPYSPITMHSPRHPNTWPSMSSLPTLTSTGREASTWPTNVRSPSYGWTTPLHITVSAPTCIQTDKNAVNLSMCVWMRMCVCVCVCVCVCARARTLIYHRAGFFVWILFL